MKRTLIGCCLSIVGAIGYLAVMIFAGFNLAPGWSTPPGRFLTTITNAEMTFPFIASLCIMAVGFIIMGNEFYNK